ncbi:MAG: TonB-dependent receptor [Leisingera sp.]
MATALGAAHALATAQDTGVTDLGGIIASGGFTPVEAQEYGRPAAVVTSGEIEKRSITTLQDALRSAPGLMVNASGDSFAQVRIRGAEANHTMLLIDGVEASGGDSKYILSGLDTANLERIEVLRGP